jgi:hypothetical protein
MNFERQDDNCACSGAGGLSTTDLFAKFNPCSVPANINRKVTSENAQLVFIAVEETGQMVPGDKPKVADRVIRRWLPGWGRMVKKSSNHVYFPNI